MIYFVSVLIVDNDSNLLEFFQMSLSKDPAFLVDFCSTPHEVFEKLSESDFDVIVIDYNMPGMTGLELIQELKSKGNTSSFILFTRHFIDQIAMDSINSGVDYFLVKGDNPNKQFDTLRNIIGKAATKKLNREHLVNKEAKYRSVIESLDNGTHRKER